MCCVRSVYEIDATRWSGSLLKAQPPTTGRVVGLCLTFIGEPLDECLFATSTSAMSEIQGRAFEVKSFDVQRRLCAVRRLRRSL